MKLLTGTRYCLPEGSRASCKLDEGDVVRVSLRNFFKGWICVGVRKVSCVLCLPVGPEPWVYCSKSRFLDIVKWVESHGHDFQSEFNLQYNAGLIPMTDLDLQRTLEVRKLAVAVAYGPSQGSA